MRLMPLGVLIALSGCVAENKRLKLDGAAQYKAGKYEACAESFRAVAAIEEAAAQDPRADQAHRDLAHWSLGHDFHDLAQCLKGAGKDVEAAEALVRGLAIESQTCRSSMPGPTWDEIRRRDCAQLADDTKQLALWRERAAKPK